ncbi:transmembrane protein [Cystoisospora suis]|uniref:Transmembrane protein n=1 Tax=Cystoisospora suis TaxID=483139 RepID=A0A2C6L1F4_9APIC|nr:transmembrane protein [Cystoisospora suis]
MEVTDLQLSTGMALSLSLSLSVLSCFSCLLLFCVGLCCMSMLGLSVYVTFIVTLTLLLGLIWPAMHEVRFLSRLCNTSLIITDRLRNFIVTCPAYNRFGAKNLTLACVECPSGGGSASHATAENLDGNLYPQSQVQVHEISPSPSAESYARLEVSMHDLVEGCVTGHLGRPHACIFIENSSVGEFHFRSLRLYKEDDTAQEIDGFLAEDPVTANAGPLLSSILLSHVEEGKKTGGEITTISVEAQPFAEQSSSYFCFRRDPHHSRRLDRGGAPAEVGSEYVDQISWDLACRPIPHCIQPAETPLLEKSSCRPPSADTICPSPLGTRSLC